MRAGLQEGRTLEAPGMDDTIEQRTDEPVYEPPRFEVIPLDCEITAYAPLDDDPLL